MKIEFFHWIPLFKILWGISVILKLLCTFSSRLHLLVIFCSSAWYNKLDLPFDTFLKTECKQRRTSYTLLLLIFSISSTYSLFFFFFLKYSNSPSTFANTHTHEKRYIPVLTYFKGKELHALQNNVLFLMKESCTQYLYSWHCTHSSSLFFAFYTTFTIFNKNYCYLSLLKPRNVYASAP